MTIRNLRRGSSIAANTDNIMANERAENPGLEKTDDLADVVKRWRCGWCGSPADVNGKPLPTSVIGSPQDIERDWKGAALVNGECCLDSDVYLGHAAIADDLASVKGRERGDEL